MDVPDWLCFFERRFPSANMALVLGERPLLFDSGFGCDIDETVQLLTANGTPPDQLALVVNSHEVPYDKNRAHCFAEHH